MSPLVRIRPTPASPQGSATAQQRHTRGCFPLRRGGRSHPSCGHIGIFIILNVFTCPMSPPPSFSSDQETKAFANVRPRILCVEPHRTNASKATPSRAPVASQLRSLAVDSIVSIGSAHRFFSCLHLASTSYLHVNHGLG